MGCALVCDIVMAKPRPLASWLLALAAVATLAAAPGCAAEPTDDGAAADEAEISAPGTSRRYGPALFRNDFYTYLKRDGHFSDEQVKQLVLMPTEDSLTARGSMKAYDDALGFLSAGLGAVATLDLGDEWVSRSL